MPQVYEVQYQINVNNGPALEAIKQFQQATTQLEQLTRRFDAVARSIGKLNSAFKSISVKPINVQVNTATAEANLKRVLTLIGRVQARSKTSLSAPNMNNLVSSMQNVQKLTNSINRNVIKPKANTQAAINSLDALLRKINQVKANSKLTITASAAGSAKGAPVPVSVVPKPQTKLTRNFPTWRGVTGPVYAGTGGTFAGEMVKGMGVAYGLSTLMSGISNVFKDAAQYENISQTTKNILGISDKSATFEGNFQKMNKTIRDVGRETKFTAPQVASAGKFLAMAGYNANDIEQSIRPIANLALIGDTGLGETADVVTNMMTSYNIAPANMNRVADMLATTFTQSNVTLMDLAESFKYAGTIAHQSGLDFATTAAAIGVLGDAGIKASHAGTTLRMMLLNMQAPTKKQIAAWKTLGVTPKDSDGNLKDFGTLLQELNAAQSKFSQGDFTSLFLQAFRITASSGALALANNADKVQRIENMNKYDSFGVAEEQADAKKNTIQGLWAQMTSAFTESGMKGFESMQSNIKDFLKQMIMLMKSDSFASSLRNGMMLFLDVIKNIADVIATISKVINLFGDSGREILATAIKWQMYLGIGLSIFKSFYSTGLMIVKPLASILVLFSKIIVPMRQMVLLSRALGFGRLASMAFGVQASINTMRGATALAGATGAARGAMIGGATSEIGLIGRGLGALGGFLFTNPVGWGIMAATAIAGIGYATYQAHQKTLQAVDSVNQWGESYRKLGIDRRSITTQDEWIVASMDILSNKLLSEREQLNLSIEAFNKYWAAKRGEKPQDDKTPFANTEKGKSFKEDIDNLNGWFTSKDDKNLFGTTLLQKLYGSIQEYQNLDGQGKTFMTYGISMPWGQIPKYDKNSNMLSEQDIMNLYFAKLAATPGENPIIEKYRQRSNELYIGVSSAEDLQKEMFNLYKQLIPALPNKITYYPFSERDNLTEQDILGQYSYIGQTRSIASQMDELWTVYFNKILTSIDNGGEADIADVQNFLFHRLPHQIFNPANGPFGSPEWTKKIADIYHHPEKYGLNVSSEEFLQSVSETFSAMLQLYMQVNDKYKNAFVDFVYQNPWQLPFDGKLSLTGGIQSPTKMGENTIIDGKKYHSAWGMFDGWYWADENNKKYTPKDVSTTKTWEPTTSTGGKNSPNKSLHNGTDQSQYKSHYNQSSAPKQVIVRIENLMRVDKQTIDMTDSRQVAAINNIKQELATALLDVVQDFNANIV